MRVTLRGEAWKMARGWRGGIETSGDNPSKLTPVFPVRCRFDLSVTFVWNINSRSWPSFFQRWFFSPFFLSSLPPLSTSPSLLVTHEAASSSSWTAWGEARIACELVVSRWGFEALAPLLPLPSSFPPRFHPARKEVNEDDIKVIHRCQYNQLSSYTTFSSCFSRDIFLNSRYFCFSRGWMLLANRFSWKRLISRFFFFLNPNKIRILFVGKDWSNVVCFLNRRIVRLLSCRLCRFLLQFYD